MGPPQHVPTYGGGAWQHYDLSRPVPSGIDADQYAERRARWLRQHTDLDRAPALALAYREAGCSPAEIAEVFDIDINAVWDLLEVIADVYGTAAVEPRPQSNPVFALHSP